MLSVDVRDGEVDRVARPSSALESATSDDESDTLAVVVVVVVDEGIRDNDIDLRANTAVCRRRNDILSMMVNYEDGTRWAAIEHGESSAEVAVSDSAATLLLLLGRPSNATHSADCCLMKTRTT